MCDLFELGGDERLLPDFPDGRQVSVSFTMWDGSVRECGECTFFDPGEAGLTGMRVAWNEPVREVRFSLPRMIFAEEDDEWLLPLKAGYRVRHPEVAAFEPLRFRSTPWKDRRLDVWEGGMVPPENIGQSQAVAGGKATMQYCSCASRGRGAVCYLGVHDAKFENTFFELCVESGRAGVVPTVRKVLTRREPHGSFDFVFGFLPGDWRTAARIYRRWFDSTGMTVRSGALAYPGLMCHYDFLWQNGDVNHRFADIPGLGREAAGRGFKTLMCAGWNRGGFDTNYPDFRPEPRLGTQEELKNAVAELHEAGSKIVFYVNGYSFDRAMPLFETVGRSGAVLREDGSTVDVRWGSRTLTAMCNGAGIWRETVLGNIGYLIETIGADGVYLDQLNVLPPVCCAPGHCHDRSVILRNIDLIREARRRFGEKILLFSEWSIDAMATVLDAQLIQTVWGNLEHTFPEMYRYTFPYAGVLDMVLQKPWGGEDPSVEGRHLPEVFERLFLLGAHLWCYDHVPNAPGFGAEFASGVKLLNDFASELAAGRYRGDEGVTVSDGVKISGFELPDGRVLYCAVNRTGGAARAETPRGRLTVPTDLLSITILK